MSDENQILHSMELFPTVLEWIIIAYITRKKITFNSLTDNKIITISDDGHMSISTTREGEHSLYAAVSPTPFSECRLRWKVEVLSGHCCYIGIAFPGYTSTKTSPNDIGDTHCRYIVFSTSAKRIDRHRSNEFAYASYSCKSRYVVMEVDLIHSCLSICAEEIDGITEIGGDGKSIIGKIPIINTGSRNIGQCFPFVTLQENCKVVVTSG